MEPDFLPIQPYLSRVMGTPKSQHYNLNTYQQYLGNKILEYMFS